MRARRMQQGFTLLEIMVVVVILGLLASMVSVSVMGNKDKAEIQKACSDLSTLEEAMDLFNLGNHFYPTTDQGLDALVHKPSVGREAKNYSPDGYIKRLPKDPWGGDYQLQSPGEHGKYDIWSNGPDGEAGTEDAVDNWSQGKCGR